MDQNKIIEKKFMEIMKPFKHAVSLFLLGCCAWIQAATVDDISYRVLQGDRVQLVVELSEPLQEEPLSFTIDNPSRIALDFPDTKLGIEQHYLPVNIGLVTSISAVEAVGRTRIVLNLLQSVAYEIELEDNLVSLTLGVGSDSLFVSDKTDITKYSSVAEGAAGREGIESIDFRRGEAGEGKVIVTLSDPSVGIDMNVVGGKIVVNFLDTYLPKELDRRLDVVDFATPISEIDTSSNTEGVLMSIAMSQDQEFDHLAYQTDNTFIIEVRPLTKEEFEDLKKEKFSFTGERVSLNFQDLEVRALLQLIAEFTDLNMVVSDTVGGSVTMRLKNVPWDQALDVVLKSKGLGKRQEGNIVMVAPSDEIAARERLELEASRQIEELAPLRTEFLQVNYAKASDLAELIKTEGNNLLSDRGSVAIDERTNTLILQDVASNISAVRKMVGELDIAVRQVLIESRIVNADESFAKDIGVRFGYSKTHDGGDDGVTAIIGGTSQGFLTGVDTGIVTEGAQTEGLLVDLPSIPSDAASLGLVVGNIGSWLLQLELSALIAEGRGEEIASPKVITVNQQEATIESGVEIPYQEASSSGATSVSFKKAVLSLAVTPQITPDDRILLDLQVNQDSRGSPDVLGVPPINTRGVATQVMVDNGETVVLGGVYTQVDNESIDRIPFFSDLPYVGFLFKRTSVDIDKSELLIFVTPKILKETLRI